MTQKDKLLTQIGFGRQVKDKKQGICPFCGKPKNHMPFRDYISKREAEISGLCQICQDKLFNIEEEPEND